MAAAWAGAANAPTDAARAAAKAATLVQRVRLTRFSVTFRVHGCHPKRA